MLHKLQLFAHYVTFNKIENYADLPWLLVYHFEIRRASRHTNCRTEGEITCFRTGELRTLESLEGRKTRAGSKIGIYRFIWSRQAAV